MTLDTTKPMMTRDGRKVRDFAVLKDGAMFAQLTDDAPGDGRMYWPGGKVAQGGEHPNDLINCPPEPVVLWVMMERGPVTGSWYVVDDAPADDAHKWAAEFPANRRVVRVEVPQ